jgi:hypothetical protein
MAESGTSPNSNSPADNPAATEENAEPNIKTPKKKKELNEFEQKVKQMRLYNNYVTKEIHDKKKNYPNIFVSGQLDNDEPLNFIAE